MPRLFAWLVLLAFCPTLFGLSPRTWTSADGKKIQATLMDAFGDEILIRRTDGASFRLPLARVSKVDRRYVEQSLALRVTVPSALKAVVMINTPDGGRGTGFLTQRFGEVHLMTNAHVVRGADKITVLRADGRPLVTTDTMEMARDGRDLVRFRMAADLGGLPLAGGNLGANHCPGAAALLDLQRKAQSLPCQGGSLEPVSHSQRATRGNRRTGRRQRGHRHWHPPPAAEGR